MQIYGPNYVVLFLYFTSAVLGTAFLVTYLWASRKDRRVTLAVIDAVGWVTTVAFGNAFLLHLLTPRLADPIGPTRAYAYTFIIQGTLLLLITVRWIRWFQLRRAVRQDRDDLLVGDAA